VRYFAAAAEASGAEEERLELAPAATLSWLRGHLIRTYGPAMAAAIRGGSFLVDGVAARDDETRVGDQVDVLPPFAGG
jgi:molybdopterin synthase sulfur carrier subunit